MKTYRYLATKIPILSFSYRNDKNGHIIPPEAYATLTDDFIPVVVFEEDRYITIGKARLYRKESILYGDFEFEGSSIPTEETLNVLNSLYPVGDIKVFQSAKHIILHFKVERVIIADATPTDPVVKTFTGKIWTVPSGAAMN